MKSNDLKRKQRLKRSHPGKIISTRATSTTNDASSDPTVCFNVGGKTFETYWSTIRRLPGIRLTDEDFMRRHRDETSGMYFFDADPEMFTVVLNYMRTGELHVPSTVCGPSIKHELDFWGIDDRDIERCCWTNYASWHSTMKALDELEVNRQQTFENQRTYSSAHHSKIKRIKTKIWNAVNHNDSTLASKILGWVSLILVFLSIFSSCAETHPAFAVPAEQDILGRLHTHHKIFTEPINKSLVKNSIHNSTNSTNEADDGNKLVPHPILLIINLICMVCFSLEYLARLFTAPKVFAFVFSGFGMIDLLALIPDYVEVCVEPFIGTGHPFIEFIPLLRVMRIIRVFRLMRHFASLWLLFYTLKASLRELIVLLIFLLVGMLVFSSLIYFADKRETFTSIPHSFWWAIITMTTVGYGDMYPTTMLGYIIGSMAALSGMLMVGFSVPVLVNNFLMYYTHVQCIMDQHGDDCDEDLPPNSPKWHNKRSLYAKAKRDSNGDNSETKYQENNNILPSIVIQSSSDNKNGTKPRKSLTKQHLMTEMVTHSEMEV